MHLQTFDVDGPALITAKRFEDARGSFCETWSERAFRHEVADYPFVQDNHSLSTKAGTVRGLHFQRDPHAQGKLIRVVRGAIYDVVVDVRPHSPTFGRHVPVTLRAGDGRQFWVPPGFLHGFCTLEDGAEVLYKVTDYYSAEHDAGVRWNDPELGIRWPVDAKNAILSAKDALHPTLREVFAASPVPADAGLA